MLNYGALMMGALPIIAPLRRISFWGGGRVVGTRNIIDSEGEVLASFLEEREVDA